MWNVNHPSSICFCKRIKRCEIRWCCLAAVVSSGKPVCALPRMRNSAHSFFLVSLSFSTVLYNVYFMTHIDIKKGLFMSLPRGVFCTAVIFLQKASVQSDLTQCSGKCGTWTLGRMSTNLFSLRVGKWSLTEIINRDNAEWMVIQIASLMHFTSERKLCVCGKWEGHQW